MADLSCALSALCLVAWFTNAAVTYHPSAWVVGRVLSVAFGFGVAIFAVLGIPIRAADAAAVRRRVVRLIFLGMLGAFALVLMT